MGQDATRHGTIRLGPGDFVLDGDPAPSQKEGRAPPQFSAHVYCGQTAAWIKISLGTEVGLGPDNIVLDGDPGTQLRHLQKGGTTPSPIFGPFILWPNGWMHQDATWYGGRPQPRGLCVFDGDPVPLPKKGAEPLPNFWPMSIAAKRLHGSRCHLVQR